MSFLVYNRDNSGPSTVAWLVQFNDLDDKEGGVKAIVHLASTNFESLSWNLRAFETHFLAMVREVKLAPDNRSTTITLNHCFSKYFWNHDLYKAQIFWFLHVIHINRPSADMPENELMQSSIYKLVITVTVISKYRYPQYLASEFIKSSRIK